MLKELGAIFLILGTCVAAAMLGLPVVTASERYFITVLQAVGAWFIMTLGAWCLMQVNLRMPVGSNLITMSEATLGAVGKWLTWVVYLLLLYCLICAYISASSDVIHSLLAQWQLSNQVTTVVVSLFFSAIVYRGIRMVDLLNRGLLIAKLVICFLIIFAVSPHFQSELLRQGQAQLNGSSFLVMITAFGYAIIIPSIREYLDDNARQLKRVVLIGSALPLILYLVWIAVIQGAVPRSGETGLLQMQHAGNVNSMLMTHLVALTQYPTIQFLSVLFIVISSITGLLGVSLCTVDFLADGLSVQRQGIKKAGLVALTFMPPLLIVLFKPAIFIQALAYAGICCIYILIILPIAMFYRMRAFLIFSQ